MEGGVRWKVEGGGRWRERLGGGRWREVEGEEGGGQGGGAG